MAMSLNVQSLLDRFAALTLRERLLVGAGLLGLTWMVWLVTLGDTVADRQVTVIRDVQLLRSELEAAAAERAALQASRKADPNDALRAEQKALKALLNQLNDSVAGSLSRFIPPDRMNAVLQDVLADHRGLKLKLVRRLPTVALLPDVQVATEQATQSDTKLESDSSSSAPNLYLHPLRIEIEGRYFDVMAYVKTLEQSPWRFNWRRLEFTTEQYPNGRAVIEIETLSRDKRWLGV